jgi:hypothetical protein
MQSASAPDPSRARAELSVMLDALDGLRARAASLAEPFLGTERDDVVTAVHEAERSILMAVRATQRAVRTLDR